MIGVGFRGTSHPIKSKLGHFRKRSHFNIYHIYLCLQTFFFVSKQKFIFSFVFLPVLFLFLFLFFHRQTLNWDSNARAETIVDSFPFYVILVCIRNVHRYLLPFGQFKITLKTVIKKYFGKCKKVTILQMFVRVNQPQPLLKRNVLYYLPKMDFFH